MVQEMNSNAASEDAIKMREFNEYTSKDCISEFQSLPIWQKLLGLGITPDRCVNREISYPVAALLIWTEKVAQNAVWDHKPKISRRFNSRNPTGNQHWHLYNNTLYYYDVWSNIHYGYVGAASRFSASVLLDGAGVEQIGSTLLRGSLSTKDSTVHGLRARDDKQDRIGIEIGIQLFQKYPTNLTVQNLLNQVFMNPGLQTKRYIP